MRGWTATARASADAPPPPSRKSLSFLFLLCLALALFLTFATGVVIGLIVGMNADHRGGSMSSRAVAASSLLRGAISKSSFPTKRGAISRSSFPTSAACRTAVALDDQALWHELTDRELFEAAIAVEPTPPSSTDKLAFLFLTRGPLPLAPLWERFFCGHETQFSIYIHAAPMFEFNSTSIPAVFHNRLIPSQEVVWGEVSLVDAERRLLANALLDPFNKRFVLVSESCVPLFDFPTIYDYFTKSQHSFMQVLDDPGPYGRARWNGNFLPEVPLDSWRKGHQWFEVDRKLAVVTVNDTIYYPKFRDHCKPYCYVDEHYMPTMYYILAGGRMANRTVTWVDWSRGGFHPATYARPHLNFGLFEKLKDNSNNCTWNGEPGHPCFLFARKFDQDTLPWLLYNSKRILGY